MTGRPSYDERRGRGTRPDLWPAFVPPSEIPPAELARLRANPHLDPAYIDRVLSAPWPPS